MSNLKDRMVEFKRDTGWNQAKIARVAGVKPAAVSHWCRGNSEMSLESASRLSKETVYAAEWLAHGKQPRLKPVGKASGQALTAAEPDPTSYAQGSQDSVSRALGVIARFMSTLDGLDREVVKATLRFALEHPDNAKELAKAQTQLDQLVGRKVAPQAVKAKASKATG